MTKVKPLVNFSFTVSLNNMFITSLRLLIFCLLSGLSIRGICQEIPPPPAAKIPVIHIHAENLSPLDIGLEIGRQSKQLFPDIEYRYDSYLMAILDQMGFNDILRDRLPKLKSHIDNAYQKEMEGIASSWTLIHDNKLGDGYLSWDEYWVLNLLADVGLPANGTGFGVLNTVSREKSTIIGRNLDLKSTPELRALQAITVYQYSNHVVVNIGFAGIISVLSGFNDSGLFVAHFNAASDLSYQNPYPARQETGRAMQAYGFAMRKALETMTSVRKATNTLAKNTYGISSNILIADKKNIQILEYSPVGKAQIRSWKSETHPNKQWNRASQMAVVDCHVLNSRSGSCERAKDTYRWERLRTQAIFTKNKKAGVQDIAGIMLDSHNQYYEILASDTLQSMIYLPGTGHLYLYAAPVNKTEIPPAYKIYYQDILPGKFRNLQNKNLYFWWISGLLVLLAIALWQIRRSMREKTVGNNIGLDNINTNSRV
jgi:hypothetical protein